MGQILRRLNPPPLPDTEPPPAENQIQADAHHREGQNQDDPGDFIGGIGAVIEQVHNGNDGQNIQRHIDPRPVIGQPDHGRQDDHQLQQNKKRDDHHPLKRQLANFAHKKPSFAGIGSLLLIVPHFPEVTR